MFHDILNWKKNQIVMNKTGMTDLQYEKTAKYKSLSKKLYFQRRDISLIININRRKNKAVEEKRKKEKMTPKIFYK